MLANDMNIKGEGLASTNGNHSVTKVFTSFKGLPPSISGSGVGGEFVEFSPVLLTPENRQDIRNAVERAVPTNAMAALDVLMISAILSCGNYWTKHIETQTGSADRRALWEKYVQTQFASEIEKLTNLLAAGPCEEALRKQAGEAIAEMLDEGRTALRFDYSDFESLNTFHEMIEQNVYASDVHFGMTGTVDLFDRTPRWMKFVNGVSGPLVTALTALGFLKLLSDIDVQAALTSPMLPVMLGLSAGLTIPVFSCAAKLGNGCASLKGTGPEPIPSILDKPALYRDTIVLMLGTAVISGVDILGVQQLAKESMSSSGMPIWVPFLGFGFGGLGILMKFLHSYHDAVSRYQQNALEARMQAQVDRIRVETAGAIRLLQEADWRRSAAVTLETMQAKIEGLQFVPVIAEELMAHIAREESTWVGESGRFWGRVWSIIDAEAERNYKPAKLDRRSKSAGVIGRLKAKWAKLRGQR